MIIFFDDLLVRGSRMVQEKVQDGVENLVLSFTKILRSSSRADVACTVLWEGAMKTVEYRAKSTTDFIGDYHL